MGTPKIGDICQELLLQPQARQCESVDRLMCTDRLVSQNADPLSSIEEDSKVKLISWWKLGPLIACVKVQVAVFYSTMC